MSRAAFDPIVQLDSVAHATRPKCAFHAHTRSAVAKWQSRARKALARCLALDHLAPVPLNPVVEEEVDRGTHIQRRVILHSADCSEVPVYILLPKEAQGPKRPCVLALNGHGYGVKAIIGIGEDGTYREEPAGYQRDFAVELVKRGFIVAAPEISCFGERETHYGHLPETSPHPTACHNASTYAMMLGLTVPGMRVWDGMRVVDYLQTLPEADAEHMGVMGISGGGMHAFFSACIDTRLKAAVISGYFCDWRKSILSISHCTCNFVPGLLRLGELSDLAGLIAPRPLLIENGTHDPIFPIDDVRNTVIRARAAWKVLGAENLLQEDYFEDGHRINGTVAYPFLQQHLQQPELVGAQ